MGRRGSDWAEILRWNGGMSHTLSKSRLCVYIRDGCVKILLGWITNWPGGRGTGSFQPSHPPFLTVSTLKSSTCRAASEPEPLNPGARVSVSARTLERGRKLERSALLHQHLTVGIQDRSRSSFQELKIRSISNDHIADCQTGPWCYRGNKCLLNALWGRL